MNVYGRNANVHAVCNCSNSETKSNQRNFQKFLLKFTLFDGFLSYTQHTRTTCLLRIDCSDMHMYVVFYLYLNEYTCIEIVYSISENHSICINITSEHASILKL